MSSDIRGVELKIQFPHGSTRNFNFFVFKICIGISPSAQVVSHPTWTKGSQPPPSLCMPASADVSCT